MSGSYVAVTQGTVKKQLQLNTFCAPSAGFRAASSQMSGQQFNKAEAKSRGGKKKKKEMSPASTSKKRYQIHFQRSKNKCLQKTSFESVKRKLILNRCYSLAQRCFIPNLQIFCSYVFTVTS